MYRLLALDIDGTLVNSKQLLTDTTIKAVRRAISRGVLVTICTGRSLSSAMPVIERLSLNAPFVLNNGALIFDNFINRARYIRHLPSYLAQKTINLLRDLKFHPIIYGPLPEVRNFYYDSFDPNNQSFINYTKKNRNRVHFVDDICDFLSQGLACISCDDQIEKIKDQESYIRKQLSRTELILEISPWDPAFCHLTVMPARVSKGTGLEKLALLLGIHSSEVMAIGDNLNDLDMIKFAGLGVAMANSPPETKRQANYITTSVDEDGVAQAIERYIL